MMSLAIYQSTLKKSLNFLLGVAVCVVVLILCLSALFPSIASGNSYTDLLKTLPSGMLNAIGMKGSISNFNDYLNMNFYNSIYLYILMVYVIVFPLNLISKPIEDTSLAYYLNSPVSRKKFFYSQAIAFVTGLAATCVLSVIFGIASREFFARGYQFRVAEFVKANVIIACIFFFLGSICLLFDAISKRANEAVIYGATIVIVEYFFDMLVKISDKAGWMKYLTVFTLYSADSMKNGFSAFSLKCGILIAASCLFTLLAAELFKRRDLYI